jgi:O-acetyl-ADP-ribose deacetylase (regulator of RNase III)
MDTANGNLITMAKDGKFDLIIHGCNCFCKMGKGIALEIKNEFPEAFWADRATTAGDKRKLGHYTYAHIQRDYFDLMVVNAYTQYDYKGDGINVDYDAVRSCMKLIKKDFSGYRIGVPKIGAGLAKGDWKIILRILNEELADENVTLVLYK